MTSPEAWSKILSELQSIKDYAEENTHEDQSRFFCAGIQVAIDMIDKYSKEVE